MYDRNIVSHYYNLPVILYVIHKSLIYMSHIECQSASQ